VLRSVAGIEKLVRPEGLEPPAYWFEANRSIQLSYGRAVRACDLMVSLRSHQFYQVHGPSSPRTIKSTSVPDDEQYMQAAPSVLCFVLALVVGYFAGRTWNITRGKSE
jgi:hypothetical protein